MIHRVSPADNEKMANVRVKRQTERGPVFIGGLAHSGKTPLRLALTAGSDIALSRRTYMWNRFYGRYGDLSIRSNFERCLAAMLKVRSIGELCDDANTIRELFRQGAPTYGRLFALFHEQYAQRTGKSRWGDQLGFVEQYADPIFEAYPGARMIHMIRDPRDSCEISMQQSRFRNGKTGWSTARWLQSAALAQRNQSRYAQSYRVVRYETLMAHPEQTLRDLCAFLGEDYNAMMTKQLIANSSSKSLEKLNGNPDKNVVAKNRRLSGRQLSFVQRYTQEKLEGFHYGLRPVYLTWRERISFILVDWPVNRAAMLLWHTFRAPSRMNHTTATHAGSDPKWFQE